MKKILSLLIIFFSAILMFSCSKEPQLEAVENISYNQVLTWDEVEGAEEYLLIIDEVEYLREVNYFALIHEGTYNIQIIARAEGYQDSEATTYELIIDYDQDAEILLELNGENLSWTQVEAATHYFLVINQEIIRVENTSYNINTYLNEDYLIYVYAVFPDGSTSINSNSLSN